MALPGCTPRRQTAYTNRQRERERQRTALFASLSYSCSLSHTHCRCRSVRPRSGCQSNRMRCPNNGWYTASQQSRDSAANRTCRSIPRWHSHAWSRPAELSAADRMLPCPSWAPHCECSRQTIRWYIWHHAASPPTRGLWMEGMECELDASFV